VNLVSTHAFIWDATNGMRDLNFVLPDEYGVDLQGWLLNSANGISDDGQVIAGYGHNPQGQLEAWVVVLPEPSALGLLARTLVLTRRYRRARSIPCLVADASRPN
jgi:hypothetical protein